MDNVRLSRNKSTTLYTYHLLNLLFKLSLHPQSHPRPLPSLSLPLARSLTHSLSLSLLSSLSLLKFIRFFARQQKQSFFTKVRSISIVRIEILELDCYVCNMEICNSYKHVLGY
jgi:hypothetical protein